MGDAGARGAGSIGGGPIGSSDRRRPLAFCVLSCGGGARAHCRCARRRDDGAQVPLGIAHLDAGEMPIAVRHLEPSPRDDDAAVALLLGTNGAAREGEAERGTVRTRPRHRWPFEEAGKRRGGDLGVDRAVVLVLDPGLRRLVEEGERQIGHMLQHGDETALDRAPERLLLGVLVGMWPATYVSICGAARYVAQVPRRFLWSADPQFLRHISRHD